MITVQEALRVVKKKGEDLRGFGEGLQELVCQLRFQARHDLERLHLQRRALFREEKSLLIL